MHGKRPTILPLFSARSTFFDLTRISLEEIDAAVSGKLGATRTLGNAQPACFNRQVAMYFASRVGGWSTTAIGRFYNGRDHSTVSHGVQRIEAQRESDPEIDALLSELKAQLFEQSEGRPNISALRVPGWRNQISHPDLEQLADEIVNRFADRMEKLLAEFLVCFRRACVAAKNQKR
jgi:DnaA-like protein